MKAQPAWMVIAFVIFSTYGCVQDTRSLPASGGVGYPQGLTSTITINKPPCTFTIETDPKDPYGKPKKGSARIIEGKDKCKVAESKNDEIHISDTKSPNSKRVLDIPNVHFVTEGSTQYCWFNSSGGKTCIVYP